MKPSYNSRLPNVDSVIHVQINANSYLMNAENSIVGCMVCHTKTTTVYRANHGLGFVYVCITSVVCFFQHM
jgi:hypothetical protein